MFLLATPAMAAIEGAPDLQYGNNGLAAIDTSGLGSSVVGGTIGARGPSGSTYTVSALHFEQADTTQLVISRRGYHGALDTSFGTNGFALTNLPISSQIFPQAAMPTADGGFFVAATFFDGQTGLEARVCRFKLDGTPDLPFGGKQTGCWAFPIAASEASAVERPEDRRMALATYPQDRLVVAATIKDPQQMHSQVMLAVLDMTGALDSGFGNQGTVTLPNSDVDHRAHGVAADANGNIAVATSLSTGGQVFNDGFYLNSAGNVGWAQGGIAGSAHTATAFMPNGSVVFGGMIDVSIAPLTGVYAGVLEHYTNDGTAIPVPFAPNGRFALCDVCTAQKVSDIDLQPNGLVLLTGPHQQNFDTNDEPFAVRLAPDLSADANFGNFGVSLLSFDALGGNPADISARIYAAKGHVFMVGQHGPMTKNVPSAIPVVARLDSSDVIFQDGFELFD